MKKQRKQPMTRERIVAACERAAYQRMRNILLAVVGGYADHPDVTVYELEQRGAWLRAKMSESHTTSDPVCISKTRRTK